MITADQIKARLLDISQRIESLRACCQNKDGVKIFMALPFIASLGYNLAPSEVEPSAILDGVAFDVLVRAKGEPAIGVLCYAPADKREDEAQRVANVFRACGGLPAVLVTDGASFEFYFNAGPEWGVRDAPDVRICLLDLARGATVEDEIDALVKLSRPRFSGAELNRTAIERCIVKGTKAYLAKEFIRPSAAFCGFVLKNIGAPDAAAAGDDISKWVREAFVEALVAPISEKLLGAAAAPAPRTNVSLLRPAAQA